MNKSYVYRCLSFLLAIQLMGNVLWTDVLVCLTDNSKEEVIALLDFVDGETKDEKEKDEKDEKTRYELRLEEIEHSKIALRTLHELAVFHLYHPEITTPPPELDA